MGIMSVPYAEWPEFLTRLLADLEGRVALADVLRALGEPPHQGVHLRNTRIKSIMANIGWTKGSELNVGPRMAACYVKGPPPRCTVYLHVDNPAAGTYRASHSPSPTKDEFDGRSVSTGPPHDRAVARDD